MTWINWCFNDDVFECFWWWWLCSPTFIWWWSNLINYGPHEATAMMSSLLWTVETGSETGSETVETGSLQLLMLKSLTHIPSGKTKRAMGNPLFAGLFNGKVSYNYNNTHTHTYIYIYVKSAIFHCLVWLQKGIRFLISPRQISGTIWGHSSKGCSQQRPRLHGPADNFHMSIVHIMDAKNLVQSFSIQYIQCSNVGILWNFGVMGPQQNAKNIHGSSTAAGLTGWHCQSWGTSRILLASCSWLECQLLHFSGYRHLNVGWFGKIQTGNYSSIMQGTPAETCVLSHMSHVQK